MVSEPLTEPVIPSMSWADSSPVPVAVLVAVVVLVDWDWDSMSTPWLSLLFFRVVFWELVIAMLFCNCCWREAVVFAPKVSCTCP